MWLRHGVVEIARRATAAGDPFVVVESVGWKGDAGWIAEQGIGEQLRPLASVKQCENWLAQLRTPPAHPQRGSIATRRSVLALSVQFGTSAQQVAALAQLYAEVFRPDVDDTQLIAALEAIVVVEIACVLGRDIEQLRAELHQRPRFLPDAIPSGKLKEPERGDELATFSVGGELLVTELEDIFVRLPAVPGTWHAISPSDEAWFAIADGYRDRLPLAPEDGHESARSDHYINRLAVVDGAALPDGLLEEVIWNCLTNDLGVGAVTFYQERHLVTAWKDNGRCFAVRVQIGIPGDDEEDE